MLVMKKMVKKTRLHNERGMALIETIPILVVFIVLLAYGLGFFGVVHTGILNSIASRAYAFETFRNRPNLVYFRDRPITGNVYLQYADKETRVHTVEGESHPNEDKIFATTRELAMGRDARDTQTSVDAHNQKIINHGEGRFRQDTEASPVWILVGYGICINANCGD
jgi:hypothetical protein